ncbi:vacuolar sorting protein 39 domain 2 domain-containing protein [Ditylenchus destructor]|uniref:Vacuolar sorting protein 39 domain 2 domain-containing protein n=1 Tax=Ditylenchus destructor TaxID=166010 RepID=A0AAD4N4Y3_9BILA|nr:vacuolar sorting protein 39 domain 2 domain-containing protein [Ditylenchus destructor]
MPLDQLVCASALGLLLLLSDKVLSYIDVETFAITNAAQNVKCFALNAHPTVEDPFVLQMVLATYKKELIVCRRMSDGETEIDRKISINSKKILAISYSRNAICYATEHAYFVHNLTHSNAPIHLFDFDSGLLPPLISNVGTEDFVLSGMQGLAIYVNGDGISSRPPISLGSEKLLGIEEKCPFLLCLNGDVIHIFSLLNGDRQQSLSLSTPLQSLTNIDGTLIGYGEENIIELVPISLITQQLNQLKQRAAFMLLSKGTLDKSLDLLVESEADPREVLTLNEELLDVDFVPDVVLQQCLQDSEKPKIPLNVLEDYLYKIRTLSWAFELYSEIIDSCLAKIHVINNELSKLDSLSSGTWNNVQFRSNWLANKGHYNLAAKLAADAECFEEAFDLWKQVASNKVHDDNFILEDCMECLRKVQDKEVLFGALKWMTPLKPLESMDVIEHSDALTNSDILRVVEIFEPYPEILLPYMEKRCCRTVDEKVHRKLLTLYVDALTKDSTKNQEVQAKLRNFLLFSGRLDGGFVNLTLGSNSSFAVERLLFNCNEHNGIDTLKKLTDPKSGTFDLDAAQLLCEKFSNREMVKFMLKVQLRLSREDPEIRRNIPKVLELLDADTDLEEVLSNVPADLSCAELTSSFLCRSLAHSLNQANLSRLQSTLAKKFVRDGSAMVHSKQSKTSVRISEDTQCHICSLSLGRDDFVHISNTEKVAHLRCHSAVSNVS